MPTSVPSFFPFVQYGHGRRYVRAQIKVVINRNHDKDKVAVISGMQMERPGCKPCWSSLHVRPEPEYCLVFSSILDRSYLFPHRQMSKPRIYHPNLAAPPPVPAPAPQAAAAAMSPPTPATWEMVCWRRRCAATSSRWVGGSVGLGSGYVGRTAAGMAGHGGARSSDEIRYGQEGL